ncbi:hypothetical protein FOA52_010557 [Chlamydomonas sp. UWO 241]|nr:hypothetical protein FOA52_010557 [Chlamydomonas sp. UWO 241]
MDSHEVNPTTERIDDATERGNVASECSGSTTSGILDYLTPVNSANSSPLSSPRDTPLPDTASNHSPPPAPRRSRSPSPPANPRDAPSPGTTSNNSSEAYLTGSKPAVDAGSAWRTRKPYGVACLSPDEEHEAIAASAASEAIKARKERADKFKLSAAAISWVLSPAHVPSSPAGSAATAPTAPEVSTAAAPSVFIVAKEPTVSLAAMEPAHVPSSPAGSAASTVAASAAEPAVSTVAAPAGHRSEYARVVRMIAAKVQESQSQSHKDAGATVRVLQPTVKSTGFCSFDCMAAAKESESRMAAVEKEAGATMLVLLQPTVEAVKKTPFQFSVDADRFAKMQTISAPKRIGLGSGGGAREKMAMLQQMKQRSTNALLEVPGYTPNAQRPAQPAAGARVIDERMYNASVELRTKLSKQLSEANLHATYLEQRLDESTEDLEVAQAYLLKVATEFGTTGRLAEAAAAAVRFGVDKGDAVAKVMVLCDRLLQMEHATGKLVEAYASRVPVRVPIVWVGIASEVVLVGDFDGWTKGRELSASEIDYDSSIRTFETVVPLLPGSYRVKFMVDGQWRLAPDWPMEQDAEGETNNVLEVA